MGRIIRLADRRHDETQALLPWYLTGALAASEQALVDDHIAQCAQCRADLVGERALRAEIAGLAIDSEPGWSRLRERLAAQSRPGRGNVVAAAFARVGGDLARLARRAPGLGWALAAAQAAVFAGLLIQPGSPASGYHALGAGQAAAEANVLIIFRPDTPEAVLTATLREAHLSILGGPTPADAYLARAPTAERPAILAGLRRQAVVVLAEPIDAATAH